jgi:hypothetical protein
LWETPRTVNRKSTKAMAPHRDGGQSSPPGLEQQAEIMSALWRTPDAGTKGNVATPTKCLLNGTARPDQQIRLVDQVHMAALWPTPQAKEQNETSENKVARGAHAGLNLRNAADLALWSTPNASDHKTGATDGPNREQKCLARDITRHGTTQLGSSAPTAKPGGLNPAFVCWLMGYPPAWDACGATATPSSRRSRPRS